MIIQVIRIVDWQATGFDVVITDRIQSPDWAQWVPALEPWEIGQMLGGN